MPYPYKRATFLADYMGGPHLVIVMNDPDKDGLCLLLMVSTIYPTRKHDPACVLNAGAHDFIGHPSYVVYAQANYARADHIAKMVAAKLYTVKADLDPSVFQTVADGIYQSDNSRQSVIKYARANGI